MLTVIAALDAAGGIGKAGGIPWRCPADLARFRRLTMGKTVIVGRKTWEGIPGGLPGRDVFVFGSNPGAAEPRPGFRVAVPRRVGGWMLGDMAGQPFEVFVIGGAEIYRLALPLASRMVLTRIEGDHGCDTFFPAVDWSQWEEVSREACAGPPLHTVETWERKER